MKMAVNVFASCEYLGKKWNIYLSVEELDNIQQHKQKVFRTSSQLSDH